MLIVLITCAGEAQKVLLCISILVRLVQQIQYGNYATSNVELVHEIANVMGSPAL